MIYFKWKNTWNRNHYTERKIAPAKVSHLMIACNESMKSEYNEREDLHKLKAEFIIIYHKLYLNMWMCTFLLNLLKHKWINKYR